MQVELYETTVVFSILAAMAGSIICFIYRKKHKQLSLLFIYPLASFLEMFSMDLSYLGNQTINENISVIINWSIMLFLAIEFYIISTILLKYTFEKQKLMYASIVIYTIFYFAFFFKSGFWVDKVEDYFIFQSSLIIIPSVIFLVDMFRSETIIDIHNYPPFWISVGVIQYSLCTFPITIAKDFFFGPKGTMSNLDLYSINNICYTIFFALLIKSVLCKPQTTL